MGFGKEEIKAIQAMNERVVDAIFGVEKKQREETASPLDGTPMKKAQRLSEGRVTLNDPVALGAWHDQMAQRAGLTEERPISREWVDAVVRMTKELRNAE